MYRLSDTGSAATGVSPTPSTDTPTSARPRVYCCISGGYCGERKIARMVVGILPRAAGA